jgi:hypothetical protein
MAGEEETGVQPPPSMGRAARLVALGRECAASRDVHARSPDEIVGYDETGMWTC